MRNPRRSVIGGFICVLATIMVGCETGGQTGALAGGGIGALAGQAIGGNTESTLIGAAVGTGSTSASCDSRGALMRLWQNGQATVLPPHSSSISIG